MSQAKPFSISKQVVWNAYKRVKRNRGTAGVDKMSIQDFEVGLKDNLYKIWNRMSSGSYFPPPVRTVEIPKRQGGNRSLGIPTVADRIAQMVVKMYLEGKVEPYFHPDSYGYRPEKSAIQALGVTRKRCWRYDWVLDMDIKGFFDNLNHELLMKAVRKHTDEEWILLYVERWLKAPARLESGTTVSRDKGTPQGGVISPLLANLFLHYAFDEWMRRNYTHIPFERYADDIVVHCKTEVEAKAIKASVAERLRECKLELHPEKTKIVYCKDGNRQGNYPNQKFDFLGYTFRPRVVRSYKGRYFVGFTPAVSNQATKEMRERIRKWRLHLWSGKSLKELSRVVNPVLRGWMNYYGKYCKMELRPVLWQLNRTLIRWIMRKYKRVKGSSRRAVKLLESIAKQEPEMFAHWQIGMYPKAVRR